MTTSIQIAFALAVSLALIAALMVLTYAVLPFAAVAILIARIGDRQ